MGMRMLPYNVDAEMGILGSILIDPDALELVSGFLLPEDFYRDAHRVMYETILHLSDRQIKADFLTLCDELERRKKLEQVGGASYITSLINQVPTSGNIVYYGRIVERTGALRRLIQAAGEIAALGYEEEEDVSVVLEQAEQKIFQISQRYLLAQRADVGMSELMASSMITLGQRYENRGIVVGVPSGFGDLDRLTGGFQKADLIILAARPSVGKTALALNIAYKAAAAPFHRKIGIFSLEMSDEQLGGRLIAKASGIEQQKLRTGMLDDEDWEPLVHAMEHLSSLNVRIDATPGISMQQLRSRARRWVSEHGIELIMIDYLQLITTGQTMKTENRQLEVSMISRELKNMARELNIPVIALAQLSRAVETRQVKIPQLSDLRESGSIEADADMVMFLYRDEIYNPETERKNQLDIIIAKHRSGPLGEVTLTFDKALASFSPLEPPLYVEVEDGVYEEYRGETHEEEEEDDPEHPTDPDILKVFEELDALDILDRSNTSADSADSNHISLDQAWLFNDNQKIVDIPDWDDETPE
jgi:replicative DNA helicase